MKTFLTERLELRNFGYLTKFTLLFESHGNFFGDVMDRNYDVITFFQKTFILRRSRVAIFTHIKIATMFIKKILKDSRS